MQVGDAVTRDAVVVIPGVMGSRLVDVNSGEVLWGLSSAAWWVRAWVTGDGLARLAVTDEERSGRAQRVKATGLLRFPAFAPILRGFEPYTGLVEGIPKALAHADAMLEFPYDWRLSVEHNALELAKASEAHLDRWRAHRHGSRDAKLVLVAHSMGGLLARFLTHVLGGADLVRVTVSMGTPYYGSVKTTEILGAGRGAPVPLPHRRLRQLASTMPGLYDLLPFYRCVDDGQTARRLTPRDVADIGGDGELAEQSLVRHSELVVGDSGALRLLVGVEQPTMQSLSLINGVVTPLMHTCDVDHEGKVVSRTDRKGDSTVYRGAAAAFGLPPATLPQSHGALATTDEAIAHVRDVLLNDIAGPPLRGPTQIGLDVPDLVLERQPFTITVTGTAAAAVRCRVVDAFSNTQVALPPMLRHGDATNGSVALTRPGVYRVEVKVGGASAVAQHVLVTPDDPTVAAE